VPASRRKLLIGKTNWQAPYFEIVPDHERPAEPTHQGEILAASLPRTLGNKLEEAARQHNLTPFAFGCAVMGAMLHRYTGETDVVFGTQIGGRDEVDIENLIAVFLNNLVIRFDASGLRRSRNSWHGRTERFRRRLSTSRCPSTS
jgi:Condensation domain